MVKKICLPTAGFRWKHIKQTLVPSELVVGTVIYHWRISLVNVIVLFQHGLKILCFCSNSGGAYGE